MTLNSNKTRVNCVAYGCEWTPNAMRRAYEAIVASWTEAKCPPDRLGVNAPGIGSKWGTFKRKRKRLEETNFEGVEHFSLSHLTKPDDSYTNPLFPDIDWVAYASITTWMQNVTLGWIPAIIGAPTLTYFDLFKEVAAVGRARYGFRYHQRLNLRHFSKQPPETPTSKDRIMNSQRWVGHRTTKVDSLLLYGVYPHNYLSEAHLNAPFGRTAMTLREWIEDEPAERGELKHFTDILTEWTPPAENIPILREQLFRAGRIFYWRFFEETIPRPKQPGEGFVNYTDPKNRLPGPYYRPDIHAPWEATDPIPELFCAEFYKDIKSNLMLD